MESPKSRIYWAKTYFWYRTTPSGWMYYRDPTDLDGYFLGNNPDAPPDPQSHIIIKLEDNQINAVFKINNCENSNNITNNVITGDPVYHYIFNKISGTYGAHVFRDGKKALALLPDQKRLFSYSYDKKIPV